MVTTALIGAGASILGNVLQRNAQKAAYERQQRLLDDANARENAHYTRRYYEDGTQRADTQRALNKARETLLRSNRASMGRNAVMGGTNAQAAAAKEISSETYANAVSNASANAEQRKDTIDQQHMNRVNALEQQQMTLDAQNDQANANAIGNAANQVGALAQSAIAAEMASNSSYTPTVAKAAPVVPTSNAVATAQNTIANKLMNQQSIVPPLANGLDKLDQMEHTKWGSLLGKPVTPKI